MGIDEIIKEVNKKYKGGIVSRGDNLKTYEKIPFTSPRANYVTRGGIPKYKMTEFFGAEGSGKTTSALDIIRNYQKEDKRHCVYVDLENTLNIEWGEKLGVNFNKIIVIKPQSECGETILDMALDLIRCGDVGIIVIDSIPFVIPKAVMEADLDSKSYAGNSALMTTFCSKVIPLMNKFKCTVLMINQIRDKIGVTYTAFNTPGGKMLKHSMAYRIQFSKGSMLDEKGVECVNGYANPSGNMVAMKIEKNKVSRPDRKLGSYTLNYGRGIEILIDTVELGVVLEVIIKGGAWYQYKDVKVQGKNALVKKIIELNLSNDLINEVNLKAIED